VYDGVQVEQVEVGEKWNKRVNLYSGEVPLVVNLLASWEGICTFYGTARHGITTPKRLNLPRNVRNPPMKQVVNWVNIRTQVLG
jgi:hypothetical protein